MTVQLALLWVVIIAGLVPAVAFTLTFRPRRRWSLASLDAGAWVQVVLALYVLAALRAALGHYRLPTRTWEAVATLAVGAVIDAVLWLRLARWLEFRRRPVEHPLRRASDPPSC